MSSPKPKIDLSIVVPAYQEAGVITHSLQSLAVWLDQHDYGEVEVIVVTATSPDGTAELARQEAKGFRHFHLVEPGPRVGKGRDVRAGILKASGRYRLFMDADLATPLHYLDTIQQLMAKNIDVAIAVRQLSRIHPGKRRRLLSELGNIVAQIILLPGIKDTQCGFKVFRADVAQAAFDRMTIMGWGFDLEILAITRRLGYRITTFTVPDWSDPKAKLDGLSSDSVSGVASQTLKELLRIRWNLWRGVYRLPAK